MTKDHHGADMWIKYILKKDILEVMKTMMMMIIISITFYDFFINFSPYFFFLYSSLNEIKKNLLSLHDSARNNL